MDTISKGFLSDAMLHKSVKTGFPCTPLKNFAAEQKTMDDRRLLSELVSGLNHNLNVSPSLTPDAWGGAGGVGRSGTLPDTRPPAQGDKREQQ